MREEVYYVAVNIQLQLLGVCVPSLALYTEHCLVVLGLQLR